MVTVALHAAAGCGAALLKPHQRGAAVEAHKWRGGDLQGGWRQERCETGRHASCLARQGRYLQPPPACSSPRMRQPSKQPGAHKLVELEACVGQRVRHNHHRGAGQLEGGVAEGVQAAPCEGIDASEGEAAVRGRKDLKMAGLQWHSFRQMGDSARGRAVWFAAAGKQVTRTWPDGTGHAAQSVCSSVVRQATPVQPRTSCGGHALN